MNAEIIQHTWEWLLTLSKTQLILLGCGLSVLVAVSKVIRFLFLLGMCVVLLTTVFPTLAKHYANSPLPFVVKELMRKGAEATQDPASPPPLPGQDHTK